MRRAFLFSIICTAFTLSLCEFLPSARKNAAVDFKATGQDRLNKRFNSKVKQFGYKCDSGSFYPLTQISEEIDLLCRKIIQSKKSCTSDSPRASPFGAAPKSPNCGDRKLLHYQGKISYLADPSQLYEHRIRPKNFLGKIGFGGSDLLVVKYEERGDCKTLDVINRRRRGAETKCRTDLKRAPKSFVPVNSKSTEAGRIVQSNSQS